jgi:hypothetical protein
MATARSDEEVMRQEDTPPSQIPEADVPPWEMIADGRYMPRRVRGSCRGRELG